MPEKMCENCKFWQFEGLLESRTRAANEGVCVSLAQMRGVPVWAEDITRITIGWQGKSCSAHKAKPEAPIKIEKKVPKGYSR